MALNVTITMQFNERAKKFIANLEHHRILTMHALREAVALTLQAAIQQRYTVAQSAMAVVDPQDPQPSTETPRTLEVYAALAAAESLRAATFGQVLWHLADPGALQVSSDDTGIAVHFGNIAALDLISSPSATEILTGHGSSSPYGILWRQMEFGMGALRKEGPAPIRPTPYTSSRGGWWYGKKIPGFGVPFRGTAPGNLLRDASNMPYSEDAVAFYRVFNQRLSAMLGS